MPKNRKQKLGSTGEYPQGKIHPDDEGAIKFRVFIKGDNVIIDFSSPVHWIGFDPYLASDLGRLLIEKANAILMKGKNN